MTRLIDVKEVERKAKEEIAKEAAEEAVKKLKELYLKKEKAHLVVKNIDREIQSYLGDVADAQVYESAGVKAE